MANESLRSRSRVDYHTDNSGLEHLQTGAILRIADATELMARGFSDLQRNHDNYKRWYHNEQAENRALKLSNAALKGQITKLKKVVQSAKVVDVESTNY